MQGCAESERSVRIAGFGGVFVGAAEVREEFVESSCGLHLVGAGNALARCLGRAYGPRAMRSAANTPLLLAERFDRAHAAELLLVKEDLIAAIYADTCACARCEGRAALSEVDVDARVIRPLIAWVSLGDLQEEAPLVRENRAHDPLDGEA